MRIQGESLREKLRPPRLGRPWCGLHCRSAARLDESIAQLRSQSQTSLGGRKVGRYVSAFSLPLSFHSQTEGFGRCARTEKSCCCRCCPSRCADVPVSGTNCNRIVCIASIAGRLRRGIPSSRRLRSPGRCYSSDATTRPGRRSSRRTGPTSLSHAVKVPSSWHFETVVRSLRRPESRRRSGGTTVVGRVSDRRASGRLTTRCVLW